MTLYILIYIAIYLLYWTGNLVIGKGHFIWYDLWVGIYIDTDKRKTYWAGLPCFIIIEEW